MRITVTTSRFTPVSPNARTRKTSSSLALERAVSTESQRHEALTLNLGQREVMVHVSYSKWTVFRVTGRPASGVLQSMNTFLESA